MKHEKILIVTGNPASAAAMQGILTTLGCSSIHVLAFGDDTVTEARRLRPDVILFETHSIGSTQSIDTLRALRTDGHWWIEAGFDGLALAEKGHIVYAGKCLADMLQYTAEELSGKELLSVVTRDDHEFARKHRNEHSGKTIIVMAARHDGSALAVEAQFGAAPCNKGEITVITVRKITQNEDTAPHPAVSGQNRCEAKIRGIQTIAEDPQRINMEDLDFESLNRKLSRSRHELAESELKFRTLTEFNNAPVFVIHGEGIAYYNSAFNRLSGYPPDECGTLPFIQIVHPDDREMVRTRHESRLRGEPQPTRYDIKVITRNGETRWIEICVSKITLNGLPAFLCTAVDITARMEAETALRESEQKYRALVESTSDWIWETDINYRYTYASPRCLQILGYQPQEMIGKTPFDFMTPDDAQRIRKIFEEKSDDRRAFSGLVKTNIRKDKVPVVLETSGIPISDAAGAFHGYRGIDRDITERTRSEETLMLTTKRLEALLALNQMVHATDSEIMNYALEEGVSLTGSAMGYLAFLNDTEDVLTMYAWSNSVYEQCGVANMTACYPLDTVGLWGEALRQRRPIITNDYSTPTPTKKGHPDGHVTIVRHMNVPVFDGTHIVAVAGVGNKATEYDQNDVNHLSLMMDGMWKLLKLRRSQEALRDSESRNRAMLHAIPDMIFLQDADGNFIDVHTPDQNPLAKPAKTILGKNVRDIFSGDMAQSIRTRQARIKDGSPIELLEYSLPLAIGTRHFEARMVPAEQNRVLAVVRDITEKIKADEEKAELEEQLRQSKKMESIGQRAGGIAHDFNNLLTAITGNVSMAMADVTKGTPQHDALNGAMNATKSAIALTSQLLAFSRRQIVAPRILNINEYIQSMKNMIARLIVETIMLTIRLQERLANVKIDPVQFEQILINLIVNARDAMPHGRKLTIETQNARPDGSFCEIHEIRAGQYVTCSVTDTGYGIPDEARSRIFEPFFTTKPLGKGTGLGLATTYGSVKQNGGAIDVWSLEGHGSRFTIYLPEAAGQATAPKERTPERSLKENTGSETILLVEDEPLVRDLAKRVLTRLGYTVLSCADANDALRVSEHHTGIIHLLMTDVVMPGINGSELAGILSKQRPDMKILFSSGYTDDVILRHGIIERDIQFIEKPYTPQNLAVKIRTMLDG